MPPLVVFERRLVTSSYLEVASLSIIIWDILDNLRNDYRLLFRQGRLRLPTIIYFLSRISVLAFVLVATISSTTPSISCTAFRVTSLVFFIISMGSSPFLAYLRVCAVWNWNRFIMWLFGVSWFCVVASSFIMIIGIKGLPQAESYCIDIIVGQYILAPFIANFFNHTFIVLAVTYGVCKSVIGENMSFRDTIRLMLGKKLPTVSKGLLHDSQVCYIIIVVLALTAIIWVSIQPTSVFRLTLVPPYIVLTNIMICRVFRKTRLGLYGNCKTSLQTNNDTQFQTRATSSGMATWNSRHIITDAHSGAVMPIQMAYTEGVGYKRSDYPPLSRLKESADSSFLDFGTL